MTQYRAPTIKEGADFIEKCFEREYKLSCIESLGKMYGKVLAEGIMDELRSRKKKAVPAS